MKQTKAQIREVIDRIKGADDEFLMNDCCGLDLLTDAVNNYLDKLSKKQLLELLEKGRKAKYYEEDMEKN